MRISDSSSDVCSSDLVQMARDGRIVNLDEHREDQRLGGRPPEWLLDDRRAWLIVPLIHLERLAGFLLLERSPVVADLNWEDFDLLRSGGQQAASYIAEAQSQPALADAEKFGRSEEHTSELQSLMRTSYVVFCSQKKTRHKRE